MVALITVIVGASLGLRPVVVVSGSMEPTLPVGSVVFVRDVPAAGTRPGAIVTVPRQGEATGLVVHRVVAVRTTAGVTELRLRGDANTIEDPMPYRVTTVGLYVFDTPGIGEAALLARTPLGLTVLGLYVATMLVTLIMGNTGIRFTPERSRRRRAHARTVR